MKSKKKLRSRIADPLEDLHAKLFQLKMDILEDSTLFQKEEFQALRNQIREDKLTKANRLLSFS